MKIYQRIFIVLALSLALVACSNESETKPEADQSGQKTVSQTASQPELKVSPSNGSYPFMGVAELDAFLAANTGKPTMVFFWATWCPSCKKELPELEQLHATHGEQVNIIALSVDERVENLDKFFSKGSIDLPVYWGDQALAAKYKVEAIPTMVIFDTTGKQIFAQAGVFPHSMLVAMVKKLTEQ
ncbi:redoxin domain-containing protein [Pseudodesulfovibrio sp. JC047]|uniref:TlpA family protein disulfide reductase n=1 Tax=Pseudodesulfovibrio sp. JC047 TaxID=2683199 RepID=UPI0013D655D1|nr:TlpA disulfide reductase family protein [Pseudodesulfovibrio sp. JC047]NDV20315.1 redoxin domain-containing protein [Pseudodesulfovibrio sp. JC047]